MNSDNMQQKVFDWDRHVREALDRTEFMVVASLGKEGQWICPVQYAYDPQLNLYGKSMPRSRHMNYFRENPEVAVSIFSTNRFPDGEVSGIQLRGTVHICEMFDTARDAAAHYYARQRRNIDLDEKARAHIEGGGLWRFFKITPTEAWLFNSQLFDQETEGRQRIPLESLAL